MNMQSALQRALIEAGFEDKRGEDRAPPAYTFNRQSRMALGPDVAIGAIYLCYTPYCEAVGQPGPKNRPVLVYGLFWDAARKKIEALAVVPQTTAQLDRVYPGNFPVLTSEMMTKTRSNKAGSIHFDIVHVIPNTTDFFAAYFPLGKGRTVDSSVWPDFIECRAEGVLNNLTPQNLGLGKKDIHPDWIYEGPVLSLPCAPRNQATFHPDIQGAVKNQKEWIPPGMTKEDMASIVARVHNDNGEIRSFNPVRPRHRGQGL